MKNDNTNNSELVVIYGPMKSGKSQYLITEANKYVKHYGKNQVIFIRSSVDTRDMLTRSSWVKVSDFTTRKVSRISDINFDDYKVVCIDEGQFFNDLYESVVDLLESGKIVIVSGLIGTANNVPFGRMLDLIYLADKVIQLKAVCDICGSPAIHSYYNGGDSWSNDNIKIGDEDYLALCRSCYIDKEGGL